MHTCVACTDTDTVTVPEISPLSAHSLLPVRCKHKLQTPINHHFCAITCTELSLCFSFLGKNARHYSTLIARSRVHDIEMFWLLLNSAYIYTERSREFEE